MPKLSELRDRLDKVNAVPAQDVSADLKKFKAEVRAELNLLREEHARMAEKIFEAIARIQQPEMPAPVAPEVKVEPQVNVESPVVNVEQPARTRETKFEWDSRGRVISAVTTEVK